MAQKLTKVFIDRATYEGTDNQRFILWDSAISGFGLRVYPSGKKSFVLFYRIAGRQRFLTLGRYGEELTLDQARKKAKKFLGETVDGRDPLEERQKAAQGETVEALCAAYVDRHSYRKRSGKDDRRRITQHILPAWKSRKADSIKRADAATLHTKIGRLAPYEANRTLALVSKMFELGRRWGFVPENAANPARGIDKFREQKRDRWVSKEELTRLAVAISEDRNLYARAALWLYLLTGVRKTELLRVRWEDIDFSRAELRLPDTKPGRAHHVPLSSPALTLLEKLPRQEGNPYILPGMKAGYHLVNIEKPWRRVRKAAGIEDVRLHDLRRTVGSWLAQAGHSLPLIGRILNHTDPKTTAVYTHLGDDLARRALEDHAQQVAALAGPSFLGNPNGGQKQGQEAKSSESDRIVRSSFSEVGGRA